MNSTARALLRWHCDAFPRQLLNHQKAPFTFVFTGSFLGLLSCRRFIKNTTFNIQRQISREKTSRGAQPRRILSSYHVCWDWAGHSQRWEPLEGCSRQGSLMRACAHASMVEVSSHLTRAFHFHRKNGYFHFKKYCFDP